MRLLLDTHVLLWALAHPRRLPPEVRTELESTENDVFFSAASVWEIAIKAETLRSEFGVAPEGIADAARATGFAELAIRVQHAAAVARLSLHHKDPFDRLLIAQAITEPARFITADKGLTRYSKDMVWLIL